jgi:hypothetical protein
MKIGEAHRTVQSASPLAQGSSAHQCPAPPIGNADQARCANSIYIMFRGFFSMFCPPLLWRRYAQDASVRH